MQDLFERTGIPALVRKFRNRPVEGITFPPENPDWADSSDLPPEVEEALAELEALVANAGGMPPGRIQVRVHRQVVNDLSELPPEIAALFAAALGEDAPFSSDFPRGRRGSQFRRPSEPEDSGALFAAMMMGLTPGSGGGPYTPAHIVKDDTNRALHNQNPLLGPASYLDLFDLNGEPDGKTFAERLTHNEFAGFRAAIEAQPLVMSLLTNAREQPVLPLEQELMLANLGAVCNGQLVREGDICPTGHEVATMIAEVRPGLISDAARQRLTQRPGEDEMTL